MSKNILIITIVILLASCNNTTYNKKQMPDNGLRIISLVPSVTKELMDLNMTQNIVGATSYCDISAKNKDLIVGSAIDVNIEKVLLLKPDIVFASDLIKQADINTLKHNSIKVHMLNKMHSYNEICTHFIEIGTIVNKAELVESIVSKSKIKIDSLISSITAQSDSLEIFFQIGSKPIFSVIPNTFMNDYIIFAGCKNIMSDLNKGTVTRESVLERNPDIIFITTMGITDNNEKDIWESYTELNAVKKSNIFIIDTKIASSPTVLSFTETFEQVVNCIYN